MYWLDGSSKLPFVSRCSYLLSSSRAKKFALAQDLIENQARIVKSLVKIGDFDHWCHAASELVDLVLDLVWRDEKYLHQDGIGYRQSPHKASGHLITLTFLNRPSRCNFCDPGYLPLILLIT